MEFIICLEKNNEKKCFLQKLLVVALVILIKRTRERALCKGFIILDFGERLKNTTAEELHEKKEVYNQKCYLSFAEN